MPQNDVSAGARRLREAAERAEEATLWDEAIHQYEECLSVVSSAGGAHGEDEAALLTALGRCYWAIAEARTAWRTLRRAIQLCSERSDGVGQARATVEILRIWGPPERHRQMAEDALAALGDADPHLQAHLLLFLSRRDNPHAEANFKRALEIAEQHKYDDLLIVGVEDGAWRAFDEGRIDDGVAALEQAHEAYARHHLYHYACGALRSAGFGLIAFGQLDRGYEYAWRNVEYARKVHIRFAEQLALTDCAGVLFARGEFSRCREIVEPYVGDLDFRADLYLMWLTERQGNARGAVRMMVDPERAGRTPTALSQTHAAAAATLYHAGNIDAAREALNAWAGYARAGDAFCEEIAVLHDVVPALADDALLREIVDAFARNEARRRSRLLFATLQGRAIAPARGTILLRLGRVDEALRTFEDGLAWGERERCPVDAALCLRGLADIAEQRGQPAAAAQHRARADALLRAQGAALYLADQK